MEIIKITSFAFVALFLLIIFKDEREDISIFITLITSVIIIFFLLSKINFIFQFLQSIALKANIDAVYLSTVMKILGIAYVASFCSEICKDAGANSIASKVELSGKILILFLAIPILMAVLDAILKIM
ncbi:MULTISPECIES: stage III sporulation protein AD [Clostridium]|uniref:Stage III sporulation protein AD n=1 Tax=Clostridium putrefaciens TaxID=99675 RepID=A0A381J863_9CLOT|nr:MULTISPECIES: stage III sporulation protein AD [Clostridium]MBB6697606.1 stage III sporulation protein AD [Clostridium algidicarnis]MBU3195465.1 stage III sporulation protein AD [Clostridium algidicarnis]MBU3208425.1 stage III sporulation protein AD [Clostridium algidicarnis]MBU3226979.1 stage III sporulation protein AD [Clostridium algidicarnis]MBU3250110.1 stage III sporulation protein AD [Clostridium algidicarnis]